MDLAGKPLSGLVPVGEAAQIIGFITTIANTIPTMTNFKDMMPKAKMFNCTCLSCAAYALGDHLAYCSVTASDLIFPMLTTKFTRAIIATILAAIFWQEK